MIHPGFFVAICLLSIVGMVAVVGMFLREIRHLVRAVVAKNAQELMLVEKTAQAPSRRSQTRDDDDRPPRVMGL